MGEVEGVGHLVASAVEAQAVVHRSLRTAEGEILPVVVWDVTVEIQILVVTEEGDVVLNGGITSESCPYCQEA